MNNGSVCSCVNGGRVIQQPAVLSLSDFAVKRNRLGDTSDTIMDEVYVRKIFFASVAHAVEGGGSFKTSQY